MPPHTHEPLYDAATFEDPPEVPPPSEEDLELFKQQVSEWLKIDETIRKLTVALRERKVHQRALAQKVQEFMTRHGYDNLNTQAGRIRASTRTVKQPLRVTDIRAKLLELGNEDLVSRIFDGDRPSVQKTSLRRIVPKVSLSLDL
jgi:hypothetical protein